LQWTETRLFEGTAGERSGWPIKRQAQKTKSAAEAALERASL
jgi:hypothetical protein